MVGRRRTRHKQIRHRLSSDVTRRNRDTTAASLSDIHAGWRRREYDSRMGWLNRVFRRPARRVFAAADGAFPREWSNLLARTTPFYNHLPAGQLDRLHQCIRAFISEKEFWGCQGLQITEDVRLVIAAQACLLVLGLPRLGLYPQTREVIVYPSDFGEITEAIGPDGTRYPIHDAHVGQAYPRGPVILAWDAVNHSTRDPRDGYNTVIHEFAHALDYLDGEANGAPPLEAPRQYADWQRIMSAEFNALRAALSGGRRTTLDPYGAESPAEFFAVVTEHFFEQPWRLKRNHPALYAQLRGFYRQDPAGWM